jgi:hypothetical protein
MKNRGSFALGFQGRLGNISKKLSFSCLQENGMNVKEGLESS